MNSVNEANILEIKNKSNNSVPFMFWKWIGLLFGKFQDYIYIIYISKIILYSFSIFQRVSLHGFKIFPNKWNLILEKNFHRKKCFVFSKRMKYNILLLINSLDQAMKFDYERQLSKKKKISTRNKKVVFKKEGYF